MNQNRMGSPGTLGLLMILLLAGCMNANQNEDEAMMHTKHEVVIRTTLGDIKVELFQDKAPISVQNFKRYMESGFYEGTLFHRVVENFVVQAGGFDETFTKKETLEPIINEASNGLPNIEGSVAMARTNDPHSATSQFYINLKRNDFLDANANSAGYAVFGQVVEGMDVVHKIAEVETGTKNSMKDVPVTDVIIDAVAEVHNK